MRLAGAGDSGGRAAFTAEIRDLIGELGSQARLQTPIGTEYDLHRGYQQWSETYDQPLRLFPIEEPPMQALMGAPTWPEKATA